jgi:hypothetical protein
MMTMHELYAARAPAVMCAAADDYGLVSSWQLNLQQTRVPSERRRPPLPQVRRGRSRG